MVGTYLAYLAFKTFYVLQQKKVKINQIRLKNPIRHIHQTPNRNYSKNQSLYMRKLVNKCNHTSFFPSMHKPSTTFISLRTVHSYTKLNMYNLTNVTCPRLAYQLFQFFRLFTPHIKNKKINKNERLKTRPKSLIYQTHP